MLRLVGLRVGYGPIEALHGIELTVNPGEIVALLGGNGAGKTTTLRVISGLLRPRAGFVEFQGQSLQNRKVHDIVRMGISHVPERRGIFANLTVGENLRMGAYFRKPTPSDFDHVYSLFPRIKERLGQIAGTLSGGEQQMVAISRALLAKPALMLLDEPSLGLAPQVTQLILKTIQQINKEGTTVLLVEQNAMAALQIAHRAYVLEVGEIRQQGPASQLLSDDSIRKAYLGEA